MWALWSTQATRARLHLSTGAGPWRPLCWAYTDIEWQPDDSRPDGWGAHLEGTGRARSRVRLDVAYLPDAPAHPLCSRCLRRWIDADQLVADHLARVAQPLP